MHDQEESGPSRSPITREKHKVNENLKSDCGYDKYQQKQNTFIKGLCKVYLPLLNDD